MSKTNGHVLEYVDDYLHGALTPAEQERVEQHCESCPICRVAMDEARKRLEVVRAVPTSEASAALIRSTLEGVDRYERTAGRARRWVVRGFWLATAASVLIIGGLHLYYYNLSPSPYDLKVFGQREFLADTESSLRVQLADARNNKGVKGVPVDIVLRGPSGSSFVRLASFTTDDQGTGRFRFQLPDWKEGEYELRVTAKTRGEPETIARTIKLKRSWRLMLSTDKPVYQPGQTILIRSLALRQPDLKPVTGQDVTFAITDPKGNIVFKKHDVTSKYGITSTECPLADEIIEGAYTIECKLGDTASKIAVDVKKYVLPKFRISVDLDRPYYGPSETVAGTVHAEYFFGKPVGGGTVDVEARASEAGPRTIAHTSARISESGDARFAFRLPASLIGREQDSGDARVWLDVTVRDTAGQKQSRTVSRVVTTNPIRVEVIPEAGNLVRGVKNTIYLFTSRADGQPLKTRVAISGLASEVFTNDMGAASFEITPETNEVSMTVHATDSGGIAGTKRITLTCGPAHQDFLVRTDKAVYRSGETMRLVALGGGVEPIFVDIIKDGQTILTETIDMAKGRGERQFDVPPELFGTVELCAYRFGSVGLPVRKTRVLYIHQARQLSIAATADRPEYRPAEQAKLTISLTDDRGRPTPGAVSLAAVDEAVFSVLNQAPSMEQTFFNLEQELLKPVYAIYPWSPDLTTSASPEERKLFEQAIFSSTTQKPTDVGGREATLQRLVELGLIHPRELEVLQDPELDQLLQKRWVSDDLRNLIRGNEHTVFVRSYPTKYRNLSVTRQAGLETVASAWVALLIGFCITGVILVIILVPGGLGKALFVLLSLVLLVWILMPSLSAARSQAKRVRMMSTLHELDAALQMSSNAISARHGGARVPAREPGPPVRVREWFPETLLWRPELITDEHGRASLDLSLADSITTWRLTASAVAADGRLGGMQSSIRVFQPFFVDLNLPVALTRGDEVGVPVVVYNYLDKPQTVELTLDAADWFERLDDAVKRIDLAPGDVRSTHYRMRVVRVGNHELQVTARGSGVADAIKRRIEVVPGGRRIEQVFNGTLSPSAEIDLSVPPSVIDGSVKTVLKIYPSCFSQMLEGLEAIFQMPYGCFEQTSSTTYPNVLALDYLRRTKKNAPQVEATARQFIHLGYQRLLSFEVSGGGFDWFGRSPANRTLTAYGLMEFEDMARVHDVDPNLIERTRQWLLKQRSANGSWTPEGHAMHEDPALRGARGDLARLSTTAYIAWAVYGGGRESSGADTTLSYLLSYRPSAIDDPYVLALVCRAIQAIDPRGGEATGYLNRLEQMKQSSPDGKLAWWSQTGSARTTFYGHGRSGAVETTAMAALALLNGSGDPGTLRGALAWLVQQKDARGTWYSTQATVLALKALLTGTSAPLGGNAERQIEIGTDDGQKHEVIIPADQADVMKQMELPDHADTGHHKVTLTDRSNRATVYQLTLRYHVPADEPQDRQEPLSIDLKYDRSELAVGEQVTATATVVNRMSTSAPMIILDLPVPAGFAIDADGLDALVRSEEIAKYQITPRSAIVYLRDLAPGTPLVLRYRLSATMPVNINVPPARAYEYYNPDRQAISPPARLTASLRT